MVQGRTWRKTIKFKCYNVIKWQEGAIAFIVPKLNLDNDILFFVFFMHSLSFMC